MYAQILPLRRMPKRFASFTYAVPDGVSVAPGQLVVIPFRNASLFGIVFSLHDTLAENAGAIKDIGDIMKEAPFLSAQHLTFIDIASKLWAISPATAASMMMPPLAKTKIKKLELKLFPKKKELTETKPVYSLYQSHKVHAESLIQNIQGTTLIIVPETHLIDEVKLLLSLELQKQTVIWHSQLSQKQQFERWVEIRNGEKQIILGTRGAVWLPFLSLDTVIVDYEHDDNHKHWGEAPRYHDKDAVSLLSSLHGASVHLMSFSMSARSYYFVHKGLVEKPIAKSLPTGQAGSEPIGTPVSVVDMRDERKGGNYNLFSDAVEKAIVETTGDIFLYINRRGFATAVGCNDCGYIARCTACKSPLTYSEQTKKLRCVYCSTEIPMLLSCPQCKSVVVKLIGAGTELAEKEVRRLLGQKLTHDIIRLDSDREEPLPYSKKPRIVVGTDMAFRHIRWEILETTVLIDIDKQLAIPEYLAGEKIWHVIAEIQFRSNSKHQLLIQTFEPNHVVFRSLKEPERWYRTELNGRQAVSYPPYSYLVRYMYAGMSEKEAEQESQRVFAVFQRELARRSPEGVDWTKAGKNAIVSHPIPMQPRYYRRKFWYTIMVKLQKASWQEDLIFLNSLLPDGWKVDPDPISLLSP